MQLIKYTAVRPSRRSLRESRRLLLSTRWTHAASWLQPPTSGLCARCRVCPAHVTNAECDQRACSQHDQAAASLPAADRVGLEEYYTAAQPARDRERKYVSRTIGGGGGGRSLCSSRRHVSLLLLARIYQPTRACVLRCSSQSVILGGGVRLLVSAGCIRLVCRHCTTHVSCSM